MTKEQLIELKKKISELSEEELKERNLYLRGLANGELQGPPVGYPSIDKLWLKYYKEQYIKEELPKMSAYRYLYECNKNYQDRIALSYFDKKIKFNELFKNIDTVARALISQGVKEGDIVTISLPNIPEATYLFYACSKIGVIANMVDPRTSDKGIESYIEEVKSDLVIMVEPYYGKIKGLLQKGIAKKIVLVSPSESLPSILKIGYKAKNSIDNLKKHKEKIDYNSNLMNWSTFIEGAGDIKGNINVKYKKDRPLVIEHTGGTTGNPKGVVLSNENINAVAIQSVMTGIDMKREHNWLDIMPTFIAYGVGMGLHLPLTIGMETILIPQFDADKFDELLVKHKPIHMVGVPSYWGPIINSKKLAKKDLSYMIAPTVGGDSMDVNLEKSANEFLKAHNCDSKIIKGYGMTEVTGGIAGTNDESNLIGSVGVPFVKSNISIFDVDTGMELQYNDVGEICMTGPNMMIGYFNNPEETKTVVHEHSDGTKWIHSGDIGYMDESGNIFVVDRIKRIIIRYDGFKVFPSLIESVVSTNKAVKSCKVVGIDDIEHSQGKLPKVHIVLKEEFKNKEKEILEQIKKNCKEKIPEYSLPVAYEVREEMPLTPIGKIDYRALEAEDKAKVLTKK